MPITPVSTEVSSFMATLGDQPPRVDVQEDEVALPNVWRSGSVWPLANLSTVPEAGQSGQNPGPLLLARPQCVAVYTLLTTSSS